jgi:endonuclease III
MILAGQRRGRYFPDVDSVARELTNRYGDHAHGNKANPLRELLFILCNVQTNETLYQSTYTGLISEFRTFRRLAQASEDQIARVIAHGGLSRQKARSIRQIHEKLQSDFGAPTLSPLRSWSDEECQTYLESLPGVGRKTARCVMMYSLRRKVFPTDSNCWRICRRLGWVRATRPDRSCSPRDMDRLQAGIPPELRFSMHVNLVSHGRKCCLPSVPLCHKCTIWQYCRTGRRLLGTAPGVRAATEQEAHLRGEPNISTTSRKVTLYGSDYQPEAPYF